MLSLCMLGLAAVIAIPCYFARHEVTLDNACELLSHDLHAVQNRAALNRIGAQLVFDHDGWRALDAHGEPIQGLGESHPIVRRFSKNGVFEGVSVGEIALGADSAVGIDERGLIAEQGAVVLSFRERSRRVEIGSGTGQVRWFEGTSSDPSEAQLLK